MQLRNGPHGYGVVTKLLHWATVALVVAQFTVGYLMDDDGGGHGRGRGRGRGGSGHGRGGDDGFSDLDLLPVHAALGVTIIAVVLVRVGWRRRGLPPWDTRG